MAADVAVGLRDGAERGREVLAERDAVEADHAEVGGHGQAAAVRGADAADSQQVVRADQRAGPVAQLQQPRKAVDRALDEGHLDQRLRLEARVGHALLVATVALLRAVGGRQRAADHRDAPVAQQHQPRHRVGDGGLVVDRDAGMRGMAVVGQHVGHALGAQPLERLRGRGVGDHEDQAVDIAGQEHVDRALLLVELVAGGDRDDRVAAGHGRLRDALQAFGEGGVEQRGQHHAEHAAALGAQGAGAGIRQVVQLACRALDQVARGAADLVGEIEDARDGGDGNAGLGRDCLDAHRWVLCNRLHWTAAV